jgi:hypothetical protein
VGRIGTGWRLAVKSWNVVEGDRSLLVLPALSLVATLAAALVLFVPAAYFADQDHSHWPFIIAAVIGAYPLTFIATYFGVAFVGVASRRLAGQPATTSDGFDCARARLTVIAQWALLATLVGIVLQLLERVRGGALFARIVGAVLGAAWSLATFFVVPVLALEGKGPIAATKESVALIKKRWGEGIAGATVISGAFMLLLIPVFLVGVVGWMAFNSSPAVGGLILVLAVALGLFVVVAQGAVESLFRIVLYDYAITNQVPAPFTQSDVDSPFKTKGGFFGSGQ